MEEEHDGRKKGDVTSVGSHMTKGIGVHDPINNTDGLRVMVLKLLATADPKIQTMVSMSGQQWVVEVSLAIVGLA